MSSQAAENQQYPDYILKEKVPKCIPSIVPSIVDMNKDGDPTAQLLRYEYGTSERRSKGPMSAVVRKLSDATATLDECTSFFMDRIDRFLRFSVESRGASLHEEMR
jgi:hypothetical protein